MQQSDSGNVKLVSESCYVIPCLVKQSPWVEHNLTLWLIKLCVKKKHDVTNWFHFKVLSRICLAL